MQLCGYAVMQLFDYAVMRFITAKLQNRKTSSYTPLPIYCHNPMINPISVSAATL
jgi:hypothetical protein